METIKQLKQQPKLGIVPNLVEQQVRLVRAASSGCSQPGKY
jgi:hypothetical protein